MDDKFRLESVICGAIWSRLGAEKNPWEGLLLRDGHPRHLPHCCLQHFPRIHILSGPQDGPQPLPTNSKELSVEGFLNSLKSSLKGQFQNFPVYTIG